VGAWIQKEESALNCVVCKQGDLKPGEATVTLERDEMVLVFRKVPASVCQVCGEEYVDDETTTHLLSAAEEAARSGVLVDIREYVAA
jgi:YgiT-type zinc finger domain-containing protein